MNTRRLILCTDSGADVRGAATAAERDAVTAHLHARGWPVWHWFQDVWLVVAPADVDLTALRQAVSGQMTTPERHVLLIDADDAAHLTGVGPFNAWPWIRENWTRPTATLAPSPARSQGEPVGQG